MQHLHRALPTETQKGGIGASDVTPRQEQGVLPEPESGKYVMLGFVVHATHGSIRDYA